MIAGLERPDGGTIGIGEPSFPLRAASSGRSTAPLGWCSSPTRSAPHDGIRECGLPSSRPRRAHAERREKVAAVLDLVGLGSEGLRPATALSGGTDAAGCPCPRAGRRPSPSAVRQPLSNLDLKLRERLRLELKDLQRRTGLTSVYVTHDPSRSGGAGRPHRRHAGRPNSSRPADHTTSIANPAPASSPSSSPRPISSQQRSSPSRRRGSPRFAPKPDSRRKRGTTWALNQDRRSNW